MASEIKISGLRGSLSVISTVPLPLNSHCTVASMNTSVKYMYVYSTTSNVLEI